MIDEDETTVDDTDPLEDELILDVDPLEDVLVPDAEADAARRLNCAFELEDDDWLEEDVVVWLDVEGTGVEAVGVACACADVVDVDVDVVVG